MSVAPNNPSLTYRLAQSGIFFSIPFLPEQSLILTVFYSQKIQVNEFEYMLISTREWKRPLQFAHYIVKLPESKHLIFLSLDYQEKGLEDNYYVYYISCTDFMPQENLKIIWE